MPLVTNDSPKLKNEGQKTKDKNEYMRLALTIFAESTGWIAFPVIGALYLGRWLDEKQGTEPLYFFSLTALAFIVSTIGIGITGVKYMKIIETKEALSKTLSEVEGKKKAEGLVADPDQSGGERSREEDSKSKKLENNDNRHRSQ